MEKTKRSSLSSSGLDMVYKLRGCVYRLGQNRELFPCKDGKHLHGCRDEDCRYNFKCPGYYCLPYCYLCDGKYDCPGGHDEHAASCKQWSCDGMFKCAVRGCIHLADVCNEIRDCTVLGDDELLCYQCPVNCTCLNYAIMCNDKTFFEPLLWDNLYSPIFVHISGTACLISLHEYNMNI